MTTTTNTTTGSATVLPDWVAAQWIRDLADATGITWPTTAPDRADLLDLAPRVLGAVLDELDQLRDWVDQQRAAQDAVEAAEHHSAPP